jgi:xylulokinase
VPDLALGIDLGTGGPKVAVVSADGEILSRSHRRVPTYYLPGGGAEQDPEEWWTAIREAVVEALSVDPFLASAIEVIGVTGQWGSTVPVDEEGKPVHRCILWMDTRAHRYSRQAMGASGPLSVEGYSARKVVSFIRKTAGAPALEGNDPLGHYLLLKNEHPEAFSRAKVLLEPIDWVIMRLTGRAAANPNTMILSWLIDIRHLEQPRYDKRLLALSGRDAGKLPELLPIGAVVGTLSEQAAKDLGLPATVKVVAGQADLISAVAGSGAIESLQLHMAISTTAWISCPFPRKKTDPFRQIATVPGIKPGCYVIANNHETAGVCLDWARSALFAEPAPSYQDLDAMAASVAPGSSGVIFAPWLAGERCPVFDRSLRASFLNLSLDTRREHMVRAVLEGVALNARWMYDAVVRFIGRRPRSLRAIGGGASSDLWCQVHADVMGVAVEKVRDPLWANVKGTALLALHYTGAISQEQMADAVKVERAFTPDPSASAAYDKLYREFVRLYPAQKGMYRRLNG